MDFNGWTALPLEVRRRTAAKNKTDAINSFELADLLRMNRLPSSTNAAAVPNE